MTEKATELVNEPTLLADQRSRYVSRYDVWLHNDNYTTMEFVLEILGRFFGKRGELGVRIMLQVHKSGQAIAGTYPFEIAETKVEQVHEAARAQGFPLRCSLEPQSGS